MTTTARHTAPEPPDVDGMLVDISSLVGFVPQAGPPVFVLGGALVFGSLLLAGPFALAVTLVVAMALAAAAVALLLAAVAAVVAAPYVLVRRARSYYASHHFRPGGHHARATTAITASSVEL